MKTLIMGLGNTVLRDDAAGIMVARCVYSRIKKEDVDFVELSCGGWRFIDYLRGYDKIVIIDVMYSDSRIGECRRIEPESVKASMRTQYSHGMGFFQALELARRTGMASAVKVSVYAVTAQSIYEFGEGLSREIAEKVPLICEEIIRQEGFSLEEKELHYA